MNIAFLSKRLSKAISSYFLSINIVDFNNTSLNLIIKVVIINSNILYIRVKDSIFSELNSSFIIIINSNKGTYSMPKLFKEVIDLEDFLNILRDTIILSFLGRFIYILI